MEQEQKDKLVFAVLYMNRDNDMLEFEIREALENKLSDHDIDVTLEGLCDRGIVSFVTAKDVDGTEIPFLRYRISSHGLSLFEKFKSKPFQVKQESKNLKDSGIVSIQTDETENDPENPFPIIFKNGYSYQLFLELKDATVNEKTEVADYSFIFHKLKNRTFYAINEHVTQPAFIHFLNTNFQSRISGKILPIKLPARKEKIFTKLFSQYKEGILK